MRWLRDIFRFGSIALLLGASALSMPLALAADPQLPEVHIFARDDCKFCKAEEAFLQRLAAEGAAFTLVRHDVGDDSQAHALFSRLAEAKGVPKVTPITVIGGRGIQGYAGDESTGAAIRSMIERAQAEPPISIEAFIAAEAAAVSVMGKGCDAGECGTALPEGKMVFPVIGVIDPLTAPLTGLSFVLGVIDGFNPCAMWVLVTFLMLLANVGSRRRMVAVAGLFIAAEAIMYAMILNAWHATFDFVALDRIVTPLVGLLAVGSGAFFLWRYWNVRRKSAVVCDITDTESQTRLVGKMEKIATAPLTILGALTIIGIAFSVNVIEFACSIGIPQAFAKILELNDVSFWGSQWYIGVYTLGYMVDDFIVFAGALWGISRLRNTAAFSRWSMLIGGLLMVALGCMLLFAPDILVL